MLIPQELNTTQLTEHMDAISTLYLADDEFKSLCDDYCTVKISIDKFKEMSSRNLQRELEYKHLSEELENEILYYVKNRRFR
jgi:hypothetical protein